MKSLRKVFIVSRIDDPMLEMLQPVYDACPGCEIIHLVQGGSGKGASVFSKAKNFLKKSDPTKKKRIPPGTMEFIYFESFYAKEAKEWVVQKSPDLIFVLSGIVLQDDWLTTPEYGAVHFHFASNLNFQPSHVVEYFVYKERLDLIYPSLHYPDEFIRTSEIIISERVKHHSISPIEEIKHEAMGVGIDCFVRFLEEYFIKRKRPVLPTWEHDKDLFENRKYFGNEFFSPTENADFIESLPQL